MELAPIAISHFKSILDITKVPYIRTTGNALFDPLEDKWCSGGSFRVFLSNNSESSDSVVPITFFIETQLERYRSKASEEGYFKIKLGRLEKFVSRVSGRHSIMAMYFAAENKFYFKPMLYLFNYLDAIRKRDAKSTYSTSYDHTIRFEPKPEDIEKYENKRWSAPSGEESVFFTTPFSRNSGSIEIKHKRPLYFTEDEVVEFLTKNQEYESMWKLKQKTISRIINRGD